MIDLLGRVVKTPVAALGKMMMKATDNIVSVRTETGRQQLETQEKILAELQKLDKNIIHELEQLNSLLRSLNKTVKPPPGSRARAAATGTGSIEGSLSRALGGSRARKSISKNVNHSGSLAADLNASIAPAGKLAGIINKLHTGMTGLHVGLGLLSRGLDSFTHALGIDVNKAFRGVISNEWIFISNMRKIASETIQAGQDYDKFSKKLIDIGGVVNETGVSRIKFQEIYQKRLRKGLNFEMKAGSLQRRNIIEQRHLLKNSLSVATLIGSDVDATTQIFDQWNQKLGMSNHELFQVGNTMRDIARVSGISGDNLIEAAQEASSYIKTLQRAGTLDAISAGNVIRSTALFKKYGIEEEGGNILNALASKEGYMSADPLLQNMLSRVAASNGMYTKLIGGNVLSSEMGKKTMMEGIIKEANTQLQSHFGIQDVSQLSQVLRTLNREGTAEADLKANNIRTFIEQITGMKVGALEQLNKANKEDIPLGERITDLKGRLSKATTPEQRKGIKAQLDEARQQEMARKYQTFSDALGSSNGNVGTAFAKTNKFLQKEGLSQVAGQGGLQQLSQDMISSLRKQAADAKVDFDEILGNQGLTEQGLAAAMSNVNNLAEGQTQFESLQNEVLVAIQAQQNPAMQTNMWLSQIYEKMTEWSNPLLQMLNGTMLKGAAGGGMLLHGLSLGMLGLSSASLLGKLFGLGGRGGLGLGRALMGGGRLGGRALMGSGRLGLQSLRSLFGFGAEGVAGAGEALGGSFGRFGKFAGRAALPLAALLGGVSRQFDADEMAKAYGTSWGNMSFGQRGGARGANFITGAIGGMTTGIIDTAKDLGVLFAEIMGFKVPEGLKNFSLTKFVGLGPDGWVTKAVSYVTGGIGILGEAIGSAAGNLWTWLSGVAEEGDKLDEKIAKRQKSHEEMGIDKAFNDVNNSKYNHWQQEMERDSLVEGLYGELGGKTGTAYSNTAGSILSEVLKSTENVGGAAGSDWSRVLSEIDRSKLSGPAASMFDQLMGKKQIADLEASITNDLIGSGMAVGPQFEAERDKLLLEKINELGLNPDGTKAASEAFKKMNEPGSIYTHDIHVEGLLREAFGKAKIIPIETGAFERGQGKEANNVGLEKGEMSASGEALNYNDSLSEILNVVADTISLTPAKASVSTNLFSAEDAEDYVARHVEGAKPTGPLAILPNLDSISDYLIKNQSEKLDKMIQELEEIRKNTTPEVSPNRSGGRAEKLPKSSVPPMARDPIRGYWKGVQYPVYAEQSNVGGNLNGGGV